MTVIRIIDNRLTEDDFKPATEGSAAIDLRACIDSPIELYPSRKTLVPLGFEMALEEGKAALLLPRSGAGHRDGIVLGNLVGLIDEDYRGELKASIWNYNQEGVPFTIAPMDKLCQMMIVDRYDYRNLSFQTQPLSMTARGAGGFGHTGRT